MKKFKTTKQAGRERRIAEIQAVKCYGAYKPRDKRPADRKSSMARVYNDHLKNVYGD